MSLSASCPQSMLTSPSRSILPLSLWIKCLHGQGMPLNLLRCRLFLRFSQARDTVHTEMEKGKNKGTNFTLGKITWCNVAGMKTRDRKIQVRTVKAIL